MVRVAEIYVITTGSLIHLINIVWCRENLQYSRLAMLHLRDSWLQITGAGFIDKSVD